MSTQISTQPVPNQSWREVEGLEEFARIFERSGEKFATVILGPIEDSSAIAKFDILVNFASSSFSLKANANPCDFDSNVQFTVNKVLNGGTVTTVDSGQNGKWNLSQDEETEEFYLSVVLDKERLEIFPTPFRFSDPEHSRIYGVVLTKAKDCAHVDKDIEAVEAKRKKAHIKIAENVVGQSTQAPTNLDLRSADSTKPSNKDLNPLVPVSIVVGYTIEASNIYSEAKLKTMLKAVEADLAKSLENSGVNVGFNSDEQVRFEIRTDLIKTNKTVSDLSVEETVFLLSHRESRFKQMHEGRNGANLVFLLTGGFQGYHYKEFAVVGVLTLNNGVFQHELGHMVATMGGSLPVPSHHGLVDTGGHGTCSWATLMEPGSDTRINCWSTQNLQTSILPGTTITATGNDQFVADYFRLAAEKMLQLGL